MQVCELFSFRCPNRLKSKQNGSKSLSVLQSNKPPYLSRRFRDVSGRKAVRNAPLGQSQLQRLSEQFSVLQRDVGLVSGGHTTNTVC